jgi:hypothetical protein
MPSPKRSFAQLPMVSWFDPAQLIDTGLKSVISQVIGQRSDRRLLQALAARRNEPFDYTVGYREIGDRVEEDPAQPREEIWIDYIADTGDGWNSTYAIAYCAAQPALNVALDGHSFETRRGDLLVLGGDQVYPAPSRAEYRDRLLVPFSLAFGDAQSSEPPHVFAIPGNHDWYDGLESFTRIFCSDLGGRRMAGWRTRQRRSYFALKLPGRWWLLGSDGQLQADADAPQIEYFRYIATHQMRAGDRVILCLSEPSWIYAHKYESHGAEFVETDLLHFTNEVFARKNIEVKIVLAGDLHHYRRHEELDASDASAKMQKITAGGGGAFLHPTHDKDLSLIVEHVDVAGQPQRSFALKAAYPPPDVSRRLTWRNFLFPWLNPTFGIVPAALYLLTAWLFGASIGFEAPHGIWDSVVLTLKAFEKNPGLALWIILLIGAFILFTDTHSKLYKWIGGFLHVAAHYVCIFYVGWGATFLASAYLPDEPFTKFAFMAVAMLAAGWLIGSFIVGVYLLISLNLFGRHSEEAFSALRIQDYKHFLRFHVKADGTLTIYPIKVERVPRRWRERRADEAGSTPSAVVPTEPLRAQLIEAPITLQPRSAISREAQRTVELGVLNETTQNP